MSCRSSFKTLQMLQPGYREAPSVPASLFQFRGGPPRKVQPPSREQGAYATQVGDPMDQPVVPLGCLYLHRVGHRPRNRDVSRRER